MEFGIRDIYNKPRRLVEDAMKKALEDLGYNYEADIHSAGEEVTNFYFTIKEAKGWFGDKQKVTAIIFEEEGSPSINVSFFNKNEEEKEIAIRILNLMRALLDKPTENKDKSPHRSYVNICTNMIKLIDSGREQWFSILIGWFKEYASVDVVNTDLKSDISIGMKEENIPGTFPFNNISGETIEATLIGWQTQVAIDFASQQNYITRDELSDFLAILTKTALGKSERWTLSAGAQFGDKPLAFEDIALALAYYIMNETLNSESVISVAKELESHGATLLVGFTQLSVATAFGDETTTHQIMKRLKPE